MSEAYVGEIRMFAGNFAPVGWLFCEGQRLPIAEYEVLYNLIGTTYGGDGQQTFQLPDLRGRVPVSQGTGPGLGPRVMGEKAGVEEVALTTSQLAAHEHGALAVAANGNQASPSNNALAGSEATALYSLGDPDVQLAPSAVTVVGGGQPHGNLQPSLCVNYIISLFGIYPSQ